MILSLVIQGLFAYLLEYFAANYALSNKLTTAADGTLPAFGRGGFRRPDRRHGNPNRQRLPGRQRLRLHAVIAFTVAIAILGTTLAAMNTGVRISFAMAQDSEMPDIMGLLHGKYATPYIGVVIMVIVSAVIGAVGVLGGVIALTGITLASNLGTFVLYALICGLTSWPLPGPRLQPLQARCHPGAGLILNVVMVLAIFVIGS